MFKKASALLMLFLILSIGAYSQDFIGQKCTVFLKNGEKLTGKLTLVTEDHLFLKVKESLFYSKEHKIPLSEVREVRDLNNQIVEVKSDGRIIEDVDLLDPSEEKELIRMLLKEENPPAVVKEEPVDFSEEETQVEEDTVQKAPQPAIEKAEKETTKVSPGIIRRPEEKSPRLTRSVEERVTDKSKPPKPIPPLTVKPSVDKHPEMPPPGEQRATDVTLSALERLTGSIDRFNGRLVLALSVMGVSLVFLAGAIILILKKQVGLNNQNRTDPFPSRVIKVQGEYGVIDEGSRGGIEQGEILIVKRRDRTGLSTIGLVQAVKVLQHLAGVQLIEKLRETSLQVGDIVYKKNHISAEMDLVVEAPRRIKQKAIVCPVES